MYVSNQIHVYIKPDVVGVVIKTEYYNLIIF